MAGDSIWFTTDSALFRPGDEAWNAVAAYAGPLRRLLERRYRFLPETDRDDLVSEVLVEIKESLARAHDRGRGRFRALLQTVVRRRVADRLRARRAVTLDGAEEAAFASPEEGEVAALDLETALLEAVARCRDHFTQGRGRDPDVLYSLADRIVHGRSNTEIAARTGASPDRVARLLERGRDEIFRALLRRELEIEEAPLERALAIFKESLRRPGEEARILDGLPDAALRSRLSEFLERFRAALPRFSGDRTAAGEELRRGLEVILGRQRAEGRR